MIIIFMQIVIMGIIAGAIMYVLNKLNSNFIFLGIIYLLLSVVVYFTFNDYKYLTFIIFAILTHIILRKTDAYKNRNT